MGSLYSCDQQFHIHINKGRWHIQKGIKYIKKDSMPSFLYTLICLNYPKYPIFLQKAYSVKIDYPIISFLKPL